MLTTLALLVLSVAPHDNAVRESVDLMWLEHFYDEHGRLVFDQIIFLDWLPCQPTELGRPRGADRRYQVKAWRLVKSANQLPQRDWVRNGYTSMWSDGDILRQMFSHEFRETWDQEDPELPEREFLPKEMRRELRLPKGWSSLTSRWPLTTPQPEENNEVPQ